MQASSPQGIYVDPRSQSGLRETLEILKRRRWSILVVLAVVVTAAVVYGLSRPTTYTAEATVLVSGTGLTPGTDDPAEVNLETERGLASSATVAAEVVTELGIDEDPADLAEEITVDAVSGTEFLTFSYTSTDPEVAQERAQAFADAYLTVRRDQVIENLLSASETVRDRITERQRELDRVNRQLDLTPPGPTRATLEAQADSLVGQIAVLEQQVSTLTPPENFEVGLVTEPAQVPAAPAGPNILVIVALAIVAGIALGIGLALLRDRLDDRIRSIGDVEYAIQAPVLVTVPTIRSWRRGETGLLDSLRDIDAPEMEAYRALRTSVLHAAKQRKLKAIMVTSASAGEGKSTVVANLSVALARAGKKVVIVSGDLRRPRLQRIFPSKKTAGVTTVLAEEDDLVDALQPAEFDNLRILHTGPVPGNPAELLGSAAMEQMVGELKDRADFVLVDAAPIVGVADAVSLAPVVDAVLLVIDSRTTSLNMLGQAVHTLNRVSALVIGAVVNNVRDAHLGTYSTRYGYYATYPTEPERASAAPAPRH